MKNKIILDLCGGTGSWSQPYKDAGYDVHVITLPDFDVLNYKPPQNVYGVLAAPPCTKFSKADTSKTRAQKDFTEGMETVNACMQIIWKLQQKGAPLEFWALENPQGYLSRFLGRSVFRFQHWEFGEENLALATKRTEIWGYFNNPTKTVNCRNIPKVQRHTLGGGNIHWAKITPEERAKTCKGFAKAFYLKNK